MEKEWQKVEIRDFNFLESAKVHVWQCVEIMDFFFMGLSGVAKKDLDVLRKGNEW